MEVRSIEEYQEHTEVLWKEVEDYSMSIVANKVTSKNFIYNGGHKKFTELDAPGIILTQLSIHHFSHIETHGRNLDVVIHKDGKKQRLRFVNDCFYQFMIVLKDESILDPNELDEHITLEEYRF